MESKMRAADRQRELPRVSWLPIWLTLMLALVLIPASAHAERQRNILLILADDVGWSDLGCYGGEIQTPTLDALAREGLRFTQFYNAARCSPSRAALTGLYPHQVGMPNLGGHLNDQCVTIAEALAPAGYECFMSGKWHLGHPGPIVRGFKEFYGFVDGHSVDCWNESAMVRLPAGKPKRSYAPGTFYSTDGITDHALDFLAEVGRTPGRPWFLYLGYNAAHFPLHCASGRHREVRAALRTRLGPRPRASSGTAKATRPRAG